MNRYLGAISFVMSLVFGTSAWAEPSLDQLRLVSLTMHRLPDCERSHQNYQCTFSILKEASQLMKELDPDHEGILETLEVGRDKCSPLGGAYDIGCIRLLQRSVLAQLRMLEMRAAIVDVERRMGDLPVSTPPSCKVYSYSQEKGTTLLEVLSLARFSTLTVKPSLYNQLQIIFNVLPSGDSEAYVYLDQKYPHEQRAEWVEKRSSTRTIVTENKGLKPTVFKGYRHLFVLACK